MWYKFEPKKKNQIVEKKYVTKSNEKSRAKINCKNRNETLYLRDIGDVDVIEDTGSTSGTDKEFVLSKQEEWAKGKEPTPRKKDPVYIIWNLSTKCQ